MPTKTTTFKEALALITSQRDLFAKRVTASEKEHLYMEASQSEQIAYQLTKVINLLQDVDITK